MQTVFIIFISLLLIACNNSDKPFTQSSAFVAKVGDEYITEDQVMYQITKLTGIQGLSKDQGIVRSNVLDSMVLAKLMAQKQKSIMSEDDLNELELEVVAYRDERLAQKYLSENITTLPPSAHDVESFYKNNLQRFGGGVFAYIEKWRLGSDCQLDNTKRRATELKITLASLECDKSSKSDIVLLSQLSNHSGINESEINIEDPIWLMENKGQTITFIENIEKRSAKPLVEVASEVRKMLAPMQFKAAMADTKAQLLKEMDVEIFDN